MPQSVSRFRARLLRDRAARSVSLLVLALACLGANLGLVDSASAQSAAAPAAPGGEPARRFASVWRLRGEINATPGGAGPARRLQAGDVVYVGERIRAESTSEVVLRTDDAGLIAVRPGGNFMAERFVADGQANDQVTLRIFAGALRMITGWVGRSNRSDYRILTPTATVGIRGTDHEPYVMTAELGATLSQPAGTYDKVNRGGTTLEASGRRLDIDPGKVGFVRAASGSTTRALLTVLLPVLLDRVPEFYLPGQFDAELDQLSAQADENALRQLEERRRTAPAAPALAAAPASPAAAPPSAAESAPAATPGGLQAAACGANDVARNWLAQLDSAVARRNASAILRLFAPQATIQANVRNSDGVLTTLEISRDEFVQSTLAAVKGLTEFRQRRPSIEGQPVEPGSCARIGVRSVVIEQGRQNGMPYRFESVEEFVLERQAGRWLAIKAATTQR